MNQISPLMVYKSLRELMRGLCLDTHKPTHGHMFYDYYCR